MRNQIQFWLVAVWVGRLLYYLPPFQAQPMGLFPFHLSTQNWQLNTRLGSSLSYHSRSSRVANGLFNSKGSSIWIKYLSLHLFPAEGIPLQLRSVCSAFGLTTHIPNPGSAFQGAAFRNIYSHFMAL